MHASLRRVTTVVLLPLTYTRRLLAWVLASMLISNRGRRMLLAVSLYSHLKKIDTNNLDNDDVRAVAHDINCLFTLVRSNEKALIIPIMLHNSIWKDVELPNEEELQLFPVRQSCRTIMKKIPAWLRYRSLSAAVEMAALIARNRRENVSFQ